MDTHGTNEEPLFSDMADDAPALLEAISKAKATVSHFLRAFSARKHKGAAYLVKVPLVDTGLSGGFCIWTGEREAEHPQVPAVHLWLLVHDVLEDLLFAHTFEVPTALPGLSVGQSYVVLPDHLEDWMIHDDGVVYGGYTLRVQRDTLSKAGRRQFDEHSGTTRFAEELP